MKQYKLKQDMLLPSGLIKAGTEGIRFTRNRYYAGEDHNQVWYKFGHAEYRETFIVQYPDWFEEVQPIGVVVVDRHSIEKYTVLQVKITIPDEISRLSGIPIALLGNHIAESIKTFFKL